MGLNIDIIGAEQGLATLDRQILNNIHIFAAPVVTFTRITLRILVGHDATLSLENGLADKILRSDQLDFTRLSFRLP